MKKLFLFILLFFPAFSYASTFSFTPNPATTDNYRQAIWSHDGNDTTDFWELCENPDPDAVCNMTFTAQPLHTGTFETTIGFENLYLPAGTYKIVNFNDENYINYGTYTYNDIVASPDFIQEYTWTINEPITGGYFSVGSTMTKDNTQNTILNSLIDWGSSVFAIISVVIGIGLAYLVFRFGWRKTKMSLGGYLDAKADRTHSDTVTYRGRKFRRNRDGWTME